MRLHVRARHWLMSSAACVSAAIEWKKIFPVQMHNNGITCKCWNHTRVSKLSWTSENIYSCNVICEMSSSQSQLLYPLSTTWRSLRAAVWTMIIKRNVKVKSKRKRSGRPWRSSMSPKNWLKAPCTTCWKQMWVACRLNLIHFVLQMAH